LIKFGVAASDLGPVTRSIRTAAVLAALLLGLAFVGCGSSRSDSSTAAGLGPESPYFQQLAAAAAPLKGKSIPSPMDREASAAEYRRTATRLEGFLAEVRAYLRRLEAIEPPPGCDLFQRRMERAWRASIPAYEGAIPLYRRGEKELIERYWLRAYRLLEPLTAPMAALDGSKRLPCA
jgi:hypothetical protein